MTDSAIWWKADTQRRAEVTASRISASVSWASLLSVVVLGGLSGCGQEDNKAPSAEALPSHQPPAEISLSKPSSLATGLIPLPTREQVLSSVPEGRADPFAPTMVSSTAMTFQVDRDAAAGPDFKVRGVVAVGAELRALVSLSEVSGTVCVGPRGRCPGDAAALLPIGWTVNSIDLDRGCLSLSISRESQRLCIA